MLITCKMEINYSERASSMLEFAAINESGELACINRADPGPTARSGERKLDRSDWILAGRHRRRNRMYRARLTAAF